MAGNTAHPAGPRCERQRYENSQELSQGYMREKPLGEQCIKKQSGLFQSSQEQLDWRDLSTSVFSRGSSEELSQPGATAWINNGFEDGKQRVRRDKEG